MVTIKTKEKMKTIRIFSLAVLAAALLSCQKTSEAVSSEKMVDVKIVVGVEQTKGSIDGAHFSFSAGDQIGIAANVKSAKIYPLTTTEGGANAVFEGEIPASLLENGRACYPYNDKAVCSSVANFQLNTPSLEQVGVKGSVAKENSVTMCATYTDITEGLTFVQFNALFKVSVAGNGIKAIKVETTTTNATDAKLQGSLALPSDKKANYSTTSGVSSTSNGEKYVTLVPSGATFEPGDYYIAILATQVNERKLTDLTVTYTKSDDTTVSRHSDNDLTIVPGHIYNLNIDETKCN